MHRRLFLGGALAAAVAPTAKAAPSGDVGAYAARLRSGLERVGGGRFMAEVEVQLLALHQKARAQAGLHALTHDAGLAAAARAHACDQMLRSYFGDVSPEGFTPIHRAGLFARSFVGLPGENLAETAGIFPNEADTLMTSWLANAGHKGNILGPVQSHLGLGVVEARGIVMAVAVFGQQFARLAADLPLRPDLAAIAPALAMASPGIDNFNLQPVAGGPSLGPYRADAPSSIVPSGAYTVRPRFEGLTGSTIVFGPIVEL